MKVQFTYTWYGRDEPFTAVFIPLPLLVYLKDKGSKGFAFGWLLWALSIRWD